MPPLAARFDVRKVNHEGGRIGHLVQKVGLRPIDLDLKSVIVHHPDAAERPGLSREHVRRAHDIIQVRSCSQRVGCRVQRPFPGILEVACLDRFAVVEPGILSQVEGECHAIRSLVPALGDVRGHVEVFVKPDQSAEYLDYVAGR